jgi:Histidine phosphatase superfamily (branch 1)
MAQPDWASSAPRPWDPPLSAFGFKQAEARGQELQGAGMRPALVVASPFTRCIQTACSLMRAAGLSPRSLVVDARVAEWMSVRNLNLGYLKPDARASLEADVQAVFWGAVPELGIRSVIARAWSQEASRKVRFNVPRTVYGPAGVTKRMHNIGIDIRVHALVRVHMPCCCAGTVGYTAVSSSA